MSEIEELELPILCNDTNFKNVFIYEEDIVVKMVSDIIGISHQILSNNVILVYNDQSIYTRIEKVKRCDFIIRILDDMIINLELNPESYSGMLGKGISYLSQLFDTSSNMYERSDKDLLIAQINFNCYKGELSKPLAKYVLSEVDINKLYERNIKFFDLNVG